MQSLRTAFVDSSAGAQLGRLCDRADAGRQLAQKLMAYADRPDVIVLGLPRGGVPVAYEIAKALHAPLDVFIARKLGAPGYGELAMGALASGGVRVLNQDIVRGLAIADDAIAAVIAKEQCELERRERTYRGNRPPLDICNKIIILVDDGIATGATLRAAVAALRSQAPAKLIVAVGVAPTETCETLEKEVDELVSVLKPDRFWAVSHWFVDFAPTTDGEVCALLTKAAMFQPAKKAQVGETFPMQICVDKVTLLGDLSIPEQAKGLVLFAHGSGSSRLSPRNRFVAQALQAGGLATLLFDLLTVEEEAIDVRTRQLRFDIELLTQRLVAVTDWVLRQPPTQGLNIGYFGASTGAAAALIAAAQRPSVIAAVVSRGGRPELALTHLAHVKAPTLLIVGGADTPIIHMNEQALGALPAEAKLAIVPGATHLFEEPGALEQVAALACDWFQRHFGVNQAKLPLEALQATKRLPRR
ncbi:MAG: alpha/beta family hydrolase [Caldilineaceae bacterium]